MLSRGCMMAVLTYDKRTGVFRWRASRRVAGSKNQKGYRQIKIASRYYSASKLAWYYSKGTYPKREIDHKDINKDNNAIRNLRLASRSQNCANTPVRSSNKIGTKGVGRRENGKFRAYHAWGRPFQPRCV